jgi:predicted RNA binding protein YcfA (HicA-like mRNA interferase family)
VERGELRRAIAARPASVRHQELCRLFEAYGWQRLRVTGSHYIYKKAGERPFPIPFHGSTVPPFIVRSALSLLSEDVDDEDDD